MNKREKRKLCELFDNLHDEINSIHHILPYPRQTLDIEQYKKVIAMANLLLRVLKDTAENIIDDFDIEDIYVSEFIDEHSGCYSYPCCDLSPLGCCVIHGMDAEPYGHR